MMNKEFQILMVSILWEKSEKVKRILKGKRKIKPTAFFNNTFEYDIVLYEKLEDNYYQFCIKTEKIPYLLNSNKEIKEQLFCISEVENLWVIKGEWKPNYKGIGYHVCPTINTPGEFEIGLSSNGIDIETFIKVDVNPNISDFNLEALKSDFEGEFWNLLTLKSSKINIDKTELKDGEKKYQFSETKNILKFLSYFDKIAQNPKRELKHSTKLLPIEKVKPIPETYKKIAQFGLSKDLPSKSYVENIDIYENRFVCTMLHDIFKIAENNKKFTGKNIEQFKRKIETNNEQIEKLINPPQLSEKELIQEENSKRTEFNLLKNKWIEISKKLALHKKGEQSKLGMTIETVVNKSLNYYKGTVSSVKSDIVLPDEFIEYVTLNETFIMMCNSERKQEGEKGTYIIKSISDVYSNELIRSKKHLEKHKSNYKLLKNKNFNQYAILKDKDKVKFEIERKNQIETIKKQNIAIEKQIKQLENFHIEFENIYPEIKKKINSDFYKSVKFKNLLGFKPSMTFIQNPNYRTIYSLYQEILKSEGIDIKIFEQFEELTKYGVREMPILYEIWTLITVLSTLNSSFHLNYNSKDIKKLLETVTPECKKPDKHIRIEFEKQINGRKVILHYQKKLENKKIPDIILEISTKKKIIFVVLDAKFKNYNYKASAIYEVRNMVEKYGLDSNYHVFTIHPCNDIQTDKGKVRLTNFGGDYIHIESGEKKYPFHQFGYIKAKPNQKENIKKIIGMSLEYLTEQNHNALKGGTKDPKPENAMICFNCGKEDFLIETHIRRNDKYYTCTCKECNHKTYIDYCWNCKTKLYKHGSYWDYHRTSVWSDFDIHCPQCGMTLSDYVA